MGGAGSNEFVVDTMAVEITYYLLVAEWICVNQNSAKWKKKKTILQRCKFSVPVSLFSNEHNEWLKRGDWPEVEVS